MRVFCRIALWIGIIMTFLLGAAFSFVEIRYLVSLDWQLAENVVWAGVRLGARALMFVTMVITSVVVAILDIKDGPQPAIVNILASSGLIAGIASFAFYEWYFATALVAASALFVIGVYGRLFRAE